MAYAPCKNPNCNSYGHPHPNCRCYGDGYAKGGSVTRFCDSNNSHQHGCEYFATGGQVGKQKIDPSHDVSGYMADRGLHGLLKMSSNDSDSALEKHGQYLKRGHRLIDDHLDSLFGEPKVAYQDHSKSKEMIDDWITKGGVTHDLQNSQPISEEQNFADGGDVKKTPHLMKVNPIESTHPEQNVMLNIMKGRASNYLRSIKPQENTPKLAFDDAPDQTKQKKSYDKALELAANPTKILSNIKNGSIEPEDLTHFNSMYPEMNEHLKKKMTEKIIEAQLKDKKPSYHTRQGLSLFMGVPLSGELTPQGIQAAQATFMPQPSPQGGGHGGSSEKKTSALAKTSQSYLTADEAAASRQQKQ